MLTHMGTKKIETSRLILRRFEISDARDMYANWVADPQVSRFWSWQPHKSIDETKAILARWVEEYSSPQTYHWVVWLKSIAQAVGYVYLSDIDTAGGSVSVHFSLGRKHWNQGIMPEACAAVIGFAFSALGAGRVHSHHHICNPASGRVMQKCGMRYINTAHRDIPGCARISGDYCFYEILRADIPGLQPF